MLDNIVLTIFNIGLKPLTTQHISKRANRQTISKIPRNKPHQPFYINLFFFNTMETIMYTQSTQ